MIVTEIVTINGNNFIKTYSDSNRYVVRDGISYGEAIDPIDTNRTYTEGDIMETFDDEDQTEEVDPEIEEKALAFDIIMGVIR